MPEFLRIATAVVGLALAAWAGYAAWRNQGPHRGHLIGAIILEIFALALTATAVVGLSDGHHNHDRATFIGYLIAFVIIPPAGVLLARLEPTRWGSVIITVVGLVEAILVVRLQQVFTGVG